MAGESFPYPTQNPQIQILKSAKFDYNNGVLTPLREDQIIPIHTEVTRLFVPFKDQDSMFRQDPRIQLLQHEGIFYSRYTFKEALHNMLLDLNGNGDWKALFLSTLNKKIAGDFVDVYFLSAMSGLITDISIQFAPEIKNGDYPGFNQFELDLHANNQHNEFMTAVKYVRSLMDDCIRTAPDSYKKGIHTINAPIGIGNTNKSPREYLEPGVQRELDLILVARILHDYEEGMPGDFPDIDEGLEPRTKAVQYEARWSTMLDWAEKQLKEEGDLLQLFLRAVQNKNTRLQEEVPPAA